MHKTETNQSEIVATEDLEYVDDNDDDVEEYEVAAQITIPPDGGWGWVVVMSSFFIVAINDGIIFTFGSLFSALSKDLKLSDSHIALINSTAVAFNFIFGPIVSALINRYGFRICVMIGAATSGISCLLAFLLTNFSALLVFYGMSAGFGYAMANMSAQLIVGFYFQRLRALAFTMAVTGTSVGIIVSSLVYSHLVLKIGWRYTVLFQSSLLGLCYFLAMVYRPLLSLTVVQTTTTRDPSIAGLYLPTRSISKVASRSILSNTAVDGLKKRRLFNAASNANFPTAARVISDDVRHGSSSSLLNIAGPSFTVSSHLTLIPNNKDVTFHQKDIENARSMISNTKTITILTDEKFEAAESTAKYFDLARKLSKLSVDAFKDEAVEKASEKFDAELRTNETTDKKSGINKMGTEKCSINEKKYDQFNINEKHDEKSNINQENDKTFNVNVQMVEKSDNSDKIDEKAENEKIYQINELDNKTEEKSEEIVKPSPSTAVRGSIETKSSLARKVSTHKHSVDVKFKPDIKSTPHIRVSGQKGSTQNIPLQPSVFGRISRTQKIYSGGSTLSRIRISDNPSFSGQDKMSPNRTSVFKEIFHWEKHVEETRPLYRDDAFLDGGIESLPFVHEEVTKNPIEYQLGVSRVAAVWDLRDQRGLCTTAFRRVLSTMLDPRFLKRGSFLCLCLSMMLYFIGYLIPIVYVTNRGKDNGISIESTRWFLSIVGVSGIFGRLLQTIIASRVHPLKISLTIYIIAGTTTIFSGLGMTVPIQYSYCFVFGFTTAAASAMRALIIVSLYGLENLTNCTGMVLLFQGLGCLVSTPLAGVFKKYFGYHAAFFFSGLCLIVSGLLNIFVAALVKKENRISEEDKT